jgi:putative NIF3 family GTP cyclohydrolase 1 type 2
MALYACHLPLDAHPCHGNNAQICKAFGLRRFKPFGLYHGIPVGFSGSLPKAVPYTTFKAQAQRVFGNTVCTMDFGKHTVRTVAIVSGGAGAVIDEAGQKGIDAYISGEPNLMIYNLAREYEINAIFAGHYATEMFGVKALARLLASRFRLKTEFVDMGIRF